VEQLDGYHLECWPQPQFLLQQNPVGINFQSNMKWVSHTNKVAKKISSFTYALRVLRLYLTKKQHLQVINAHVLSHLSFGMPIWAYNSNLIDRKRLNTLLLKVTRLHCRDFDRIFSNRELFEASGIRSFESLRIVTDSIMLHRLVTHPTNTELTIRLIQHTTLNTRYPNNLIFCDFSSKRIGRHSFANRAGRISQLITFPWIDLDIRQFKKKIKESTPLYISSN